MNPIKPRNAFSLTIEHTDDQPPDARIRGLVLFFGVSIALGLFPPLSEGALRDLLALTVAP
jgi:hypothetical protein